MTDLPWWGWSLMATGAIALVAVVSALFLPDFYSPPVRCDEKPEPGSEEFLAAFSRYFNVPVLRGGTAEVLQNGCRFYPAMLDAVRHARETVNFQVYIFESKGIGAEFIAAFEERARAGVEVRVLLDGFGSIRFARRDRDRLRRAGVKLEFFRPLTPLNLVRVFKRDHRRAIVVDGRVAFTGGAAVSDKWQGDARNEEEWRDSMTRFTGSLVDGVQTAFGENWFYRTGEILAGEKFYPSATEDVAAPKPLGRGPCGMALVSSPADAAQPMRIMMWISFATARRRIWISNSYFVPEDAVRDIIMQRAREGIDVRLLVPGHRTDAKPVRLVGRSHYEQLLEAGVRIFEFQPAMMHGKAVVVDGQWSVIGSANMDKRSTRLNEENVFGVSDAGFAEQLERGLQADFQRSKEIKLKEMRKRGLGVRLLERVCRLLVEQY
jgi:cardiolipin synthase